MKPNALAVSTDSGLVSGALRAFGRGPNAFNVGRPNGWGCQKNFIFVSDLFNLANPSIPSAFSDAMRCAKLLNS